MMFQLHVAIGCLNSVLYLTIVHVDSLLRLTVMCLNYILYLAKYNARDKAKV
jgi:hypothetical protein